MPDRGSDARSRCDEPAPELVHVAGLFRLHGDLQYSGEPVTQLQHALQTASLAERDGADDELVTAALLHDVGHFLEAAPGTPTLAGIDDRHQIRAARYLRGLFGQRVLAAIAGHVDAKRYLCAAEPGYRECLSVDSIRSLALQGGALSPDEARAFIARPYAADAVNVRRWDDQAKQAGRQTPTLAYFLARAAACRRR